MGFERTEKVVFSLILAVLAIIVVGLPIAIYKAMQETSAHREWFMSECMKDHKEYECDALLRAGDDRSTTTVVPMPVIIR